MSPLGGLEAKGPELFWRGAPFKFRGLSFFNALFNRSFNLDDDQRALWLDRFAGVGVTALRCWCQWDFCSPFSFADVGPENSVFDNEGGLRPRFVPLLFNLAEAMERRGMVLELTLFSQERRPNLPLPALVKAAAALTLELKGWDNVLVQVWNECSLGIRRIVEAIRGADPARLVTSSPGYSGDLGTPEHNMALDVLTPHTVRQPPALFWVEAPRQVRMLIERYGKPVIDDEPARTGMVAFGGILRGTSPEQHIAHFVGTEEAGGHYTYHHDMVQGGYGSPSTPPSGIPDPDFSSFHRTVLRAFSRSPTPTGAPRDTVQSSLTEPGW
jgi:hypothetical protein